ncbi:MAG: Gfo/Idh/MocA family oxidoreductase [Hyphomicrobiales bacterium]|nr:Gfo/Idh/MocA family oxidoreductase [Hyphomicrobiales bacterium]
MGRRHAETIRALPGIDLTALVDPTAEARAFADTIDVRWWADLPDLLADAPPDGVVIASPNHLHLDHGLACISAGLPILVEKPIAADIAAARTLVEAAEEADVALLVGHHRRHNPLMQQAKNLIDSGAIGRIIAVHATCWLYKPDDYFEAAWRGQPGAGPVFINLIHDIDLLRYLCGEVTSVVAQDSNATRGHEVEDTAVVLLTFKNGALGTVTLSDTVVGPWSWEMTADENPAYPNTTAAAYLIGGTHGSLELPKLKLWHQPKRGWWEPIEEKPVAVAPADPIAEQMKHFRDAALGRTAPLVSGREGLRSLAVIEAIKRSAATDPPAPVVLDEDG